MQRPLRIVLSLSILVSLASGLASACSGDTTSGGGTQCDPSTDPTCSNTDGGKDETSGDGVVGDIGPIPDGGPIATCKGPGAACVVATDCCNLDCTAGKTCSTAPSCVADGAACTAGGAPCCSGTCGSGGTCTPLSTTCKTAGNPCTSGGDCCSGYCPASSGKCDLGGSFCIVEGDVCARATDCCTGVCTIASGATLGVCGPPPPSGSSFCSGVDGSRCGACTDCCSRVCAPYGLTGVTICQPAEGCHVTGDLCRRDTDCCGYAGSGLPGAGNVTCDKPAGSDVGICRNPLSCNPEGDVCHYKSPAVCGTDAARDDCCDGLGAHSGVCRPDKFGVPRCYGGEPCHKTGDTCADSSDCCDGSPCVPDSSGILRCGAGPCAPVSGPCSVDADCCPGGTCYRPIGSVTGSCTPLSPPPGDAGVDAPAPTCSLYGQSCKSDSDCCDPTATPCLTAAGAPCAGATGCLCRSIIH